MGRVLASSKKDTELQFSIKDVRDLCSMAEEGYETVSLALTKGEEPKFFTVECKTSGEVLDDVEALPLAADRRRRLQEADCGKAGTPTYEKCKGEDIAEVKLTVDEGQDTEATFILESKTIQETKRARRLQTKASPSKIKEGAWERKEARAGGGRAGGRRG